MDLATNDSTKLHVTGRLAAELDFALRAMRAATLVIAGLGPSAAAKTLTKEDRTPVTVADFAVQAAVVGVLDEAFPQATLVAEEDAGRLRGDGAPRWMEDVVRAVRLVHPAATPSRILDWLDRGAGEPTPRFWTLDPVDGTKGLLRGGQFAAALALIEDGDPLVGALACPRYDRFGDEGSLAIAIRGEGAWAAPIDGGPWTRLTVSTCEDPVAARLLRSVESAGGTNRTLAKIRRELGMTAPEIRLDSQVKYLALAAGEGDLIIRLPRRGGRPENIWDHAAGALLVEEAGGRATDLRGDRLDFAAGRQMVRNLGIAASNGRLHPAALAALQRVNAPPEESRRSDRKARRH